MVPQLVLSTVVLLLLSAVAPGSSTTYTVCPSGCSFSLISAAMNTAQDGDIIDLTATTYSTIGSAYILRSFTIRTGPAGAELQGGSGWWVRNATLTLDGSFNFTNTLGIMVSAEASVNALGDVAMSSVGGFDILNLSGGLWHSHGTLSVSSVGALSNPVILYGGTFITDSQVTLQGVSLGAELLRLGATWEQNGPLTIIIKNGNAGVFPQTGTWKQYGSVTAYATNTSQAIKLYGTGTWEQMGPVTINLAQGAVGVLAEGGGNWSQQDSLTITAAADSHSDTGVLMTRAPPSAGWMQGREVTITAARGVVIGSTAWVTSYPATWWNQTAPASIYVDDAAGASFAVGASMNYTTWVASDLTTVYTSLVDRAVLCLNSSYVRLSQDALVEVVSGAQTTERIPCLAPSPSPSRTPTSSPSPSPLPLRTPTSSPSPSCTPTSSPSSSPSLMEAHRLFSLHFLTVCLLFLILFYYL